MTKDNPKKGTYWGPVSWPTITAKQAYDLSQKGTYPAADVASAAPHFQLLLNQSQWDKFKRHAQEEFLPYCVQQEKLGTKKDVLSAKEAKALSDQLDGDLADAMYNMPVKPVNEDTALLVPDAVAALKCIGAKGVDIELKAIVNSEDELSVPDADLLAFPVVKPLHVTVHQIYPGAVCATTINLYAYHNGKHPGFSAGATTLVFKTDGERLGGGGGIDMDEIFAD